MFCTCEAPQPSNGSNLDLSRGNRMTTDYELVHIHSNMFYTQFGQRFYEDVETTSVQF